VRWGVKGIKTTKDVKMEDARVGMDEWTNGRMDDGDAAKKSDDEQGKKAE
jgi:hypothetical protein